VTDSEVIASALGAAAGSEHSHANTQTINISTSQQIRIITSHFWKSFGSKRLNAAKHNPHLLSLYAFWLYLWDYSYKF